MPPARFVARHAVRSFLSDTNAVHGAGQEAVPGCVGFLNRLPGPQIALRGRFPLLHMAARFGPDRHARLVAHMEVTRKRLLGRVYNGVYSADDKLKQGDLL